MNNATPRIDRAGITICALLFILGAVIIYDAQSFSTLGAVFPRTIAVILMIFCALYVAAAWRRPQVIPPAEPGSTFRRSALFAIMMVWALTLHAVGFLTTSVVAYILITLLSNYSPWPTKKIVNRLVAGVLILGGFYILFKNFLYVPLPAGYFL